MKNTLFSVLIPILISSFSISGFTQNATLELNDDVMLGMKADSIDMWFFKNADETYVLMTKEDLSEMSEKNRKLEAELQLVKDSAAAAEKLLAKYEQYQTKADSHLTVQTNTLEVADSLYRGYKDLYSDLKPLITRPSFSFVPGIGVAIPDGNAQIVGAVGFRYNRFTAQYLIGKDFSGGMVGFDIPLSGLGK